jgi:hypothetical protein
MRIDGAQVMMEPGGKEKGKSPGKGLGLNNAFNACKDFLLLPFSWE